MKPTIPSEVLVAAATLLSDESRWCKRVVAKKQDGSETMPCDPAAVQWCSVGAISKVALTPRATDLKICEMPHYELAHYCATHEAECELVDEAEYYLDKVWQRIGMSITEGNDQRATTHGDVLDCFQRAAILAKEAGR